MDETERRIAERADCAIAANIKLQDQLAVAVTVRDISATGVRLEVGQAIHLPDEFELLVPVVADVEQRYRVRVAWRDAGMLGGEFVKPVGAPTDGRGRLPSAQRRVAE